ncbi:MAG: hypothetical protein IJT21_02720 [Synergistaceae bacterium]|nr:hypothetical protein [Synergistaceae bacterium]
MKRFAVVCALVLVMAISAGAQDFEKYSVDVPDGWTVDSIQSLSTMIFMKNDKMSMISITADNATGATAQQMANALSEVYKKQGYKDISTPVKDENGNYSITMKNPHDLASKAFFAVQNGKDGIILTVGYENGREAITKILESFAFIDGSERKLLIPTLKLDNIIAAIN